jgi:hypothetical protein
MLSQKTSLVLILVASLGIAWMTYNRQSYLPSDCCTKRLLLAALIFVIIYNMYTHTGALQTENNVEHFYYADPEAPVAPSCPKGYVIKNINGVCSCEKLPEASCPSGYSFVSGLGCTADITCPPNYTRNAQTNECQSTLKGTCPEPGVLSPTGKCKADYVCPSGYVRPFSDHPTCCVPPDMQKPEYCLN